MKNTKQYKMLASIMDHAIAEGKTHEEAFDILLTHIALVVGVEQVSTPFITFELDRKIKSTLDVDLLKDVQKDWLGEIYGTYISNAIILSDSVVNKMISKIKVEDNQTRQRLFDPIAGSGRAIMKVHDKHDNKFMYYGSEYEKTPYRIALTNMKLYNIPSRLLHANPMTDNTSASSSNWQYANMWEPIANYRLEKVKESEMDQETLETATL